MLVPMYDLVDDDLCSTRNKRGHNDIWTPDVNDPVSKRRFDGKVHRFHRWSSVGSQVEKRSTQV